MGAAAIIAWVLTSEPLVALVLAVVADLIVATPTIVKAARDPGSETASWYLASFVAGIIALASTSRFDLANVLFPLYNSTVNGLIGTLSLRKRVSSDE